MGFPPFSYDICLFVSGWTFLDFSSMMFSGISGEPIEQKAIQRNIVADAPIPHTEVRKTAEPTGSYEN